MNKKQKLVCGVHSLDVTRTKGVKINVTCIESFVFILSRSHFLHQVGNI